jgi:hypothetical protein
MIKLSFNFHSYYKKICKVFVVKTNYIPRSLVKVILKSFDFYCLAEVFSIFQLVRPTVLNSLQYCFNRHPSDSTVKKDAAWD